MPAPSRIVGLGFLLATAGFAQPATAPDSGWPKEITINGDRIVIHQPQADSWNNNQLEARVAVMVTPPGRDAVPQFGIVAISAHTKPDSENRIATLEDLKISSADFPSDSGNKPHVADEVRGTLAQWPRTIAVAKLRSDLAIGEAVKSADAAVPLKSDPPKIFVSTTPAVLVIIDGDPVIRRVRATTYSRVINTPATLLFDPAAKQYYLDGDNRWMTASNINGPWTAAANPPADLDAVKAQVTQNDQKPPGAGQANAPANAPAKPAEPQAAPPAVYVSTAPAELLQTKGPAQYSPITGTELVYATNTDNDLLMDVKTQSYFTLLSGRWFQAKSLEGPWTFIAPAELPKDFAKIPASNPKASVLASIPGTRQAEEAVISNDVPQTATVRRSAKLNVRYDGEPKFKSVSGTSLEYAINTPTEVVRAADHYFACHNAVWFVATSPQGPWEVADDIPAEIYKIPANSPLYHLRYLRIYGATPDFVYYGYTPGYLGAFVWGGVVVYGTGWYYPPWIGGVYYGWPWTWGFGYHFGWWGGGWLWHPVGFGFWYHGPAYMGRVYGWRGNPGWVANRTVVQNNINVYNRWQRTAVTTQNYQAQRPALAGRGGVGGAQRPQGATAGRGTAATPQSRPAPANSAAQSKGRGTGGAAPRARPAGRGRAGGRGK